MIIGIEGGIGTGKTLLLTTLGIADYRKGRKLFTNVKINIDDQKIIYLTKQYIYTMLERIKSGELDMKNSTVLIQEAHNYVDSRDSISMKNRTFTYWILQSRHVGRDSCDIIYDTQRFDQVDLRLRRNTDIFLRPRIIGRLKGKPKIIRVQGFFERFGKVSEFNYKIDVYRTLALYDTFEIVDY